MLDHLREIAVRDLMPHQRPRTRDLVVQLARRRELHLIAILRERREHRARLHFRRPRWRRRRFVRRRRAREQRARVSGGRQLSDERRNIRLGRDRRDELFDLALRLTRCTAEEIAMVLVRQHRREQRDAAKMELAACDEIEDQWELSGSAGAVDSLVGDRFREAEAIRAEHVHR
jgi:hypothetical protein